MRKGKPEWQKKDNKKNMHMMRMSQNYICWQAEQGWRREGVREAGEERVRYSQDNKVDK
jgi:hypothetical protein